MTTMPDAADAGASPSDDGKITCQIDGARVHIVAKHLKDFHPLITVEEYVKRFPDAPLLSPKAEEALRQKRAREGDKKPDGVPSNSTGLVRRPMHEVFGLPPAKVMNSRGEPIMVQTLSDLDEAAQSLVPMIDAGYVFDIELVKTGLIAFTLNIPSLYWGYHGTGKTSCWEQICARTNRPFMRVQHTSNTEESHIVGQYVVKEGETRFQPGPLMVAMIEGYVYCADEYDFAMPSVLSVYQPVLEGKPLVTKDAPPEFRVVRPHPNFRFVATGNTNGGGDETGLYQGTQMQNAANYSRFGIVEEVGYMLPGIEAAIIVGKAQVPEKDANRLIEFAGEVRKMFKAGNIGTTISPRELIAIAKNSVVRGGNWRLAIKQGFSNRCSRADRETVEQYAQRLFA